MIEENDNYKVMFYFLSPNVLLLIVFKIFPFHPVPLPEEWLPFPGIFYLFFGRNVSVTVKI